MALERERSPRIGRKGGQSAIPLVTLLQEKGVLDERSADLVNKVPIAIASEVLLSLGPEVRNPSAFVTNKLKDFLGTTASYHGATPTPLYYGKGGGYGPGVTQMEAVPRRQAMQHVEAQEAFTVHSNGKAITISWQSQEQAVAELLSYGILDEGSADFLMQAPEPVAKEVVSCLGPDVRNPAAFVTRKLKELRQNSRLQPPQGGETVMVHHNGVGMPLQWRGKEQTIAELRNYGILDEGSADFLMKAPELHAKDIISSLGPDVRNPSAFVTRRCKETGISAAPVPTLTVFHGGNLLNLEWPSREVALGQLTARGILDEKSADFLLKIPEDAAWDIVSRLGPDVRNPSAFVTREATKMIR